jgi:cytochrome P450
MVVQARADRRTATAGLPPGPSRPRLLNTLAWARRTLPLLDECAGRYGDIFALRMLHGETYVVVGSPELAREAFDTDVAALYTGWANMDMLHVFGPNSLFVLDEDEHVAKRKLLLPLYGDRLRRHGAHPAEIVWSELARWPRGKPFALAPRMHDLALEIFMRAAFGDSEVPRLARMRRVLQAMLRALHRPGQDMLLGLLGPERGSRLVKTAPWLWRINRTLADEIARRRLAPDLEQRSDTLSLLLLARHQDGSQLDDAEVRDHLITLLLAGHVMIATSATWAIERLTQHPEKMRRLRDELQAGADEYLGAVIKEALRLRPVLPMVRRRVKAPITVGGYDIPVGARLFVALYLINRHPRSFARPDAFEPERWLDDSVEPGRSIPFGGGARRCIGASFAMHLLPLLLTELVTRTDLRAATDAGEQPARRNLITFAPKGARVVWA